LDSQGPDVFGRTQPASQGTTSFWDDVRAGIGEEARALVMENVEIEYRTFVLANAHIQQQKISSVVQDFDEYLKLEPNAPGSGQIRQRRDRMREGLQRAQPTANSPKP
jgi:hypothetical protein